MFKAYFGKCIRDTMVDVWEYCGKCMVDSVVNVQQPLRLEERNATCQQDVGEVVGTEEYQMREYEIRVGQASLSGR